jgi:hypothetical protein
MPAYRAYMLDEHNHIRATETIHADVLSEALDAALRMIQDVQHLKAVELWEGVVFADGVDRFAARLDLDVPGQSCN